MNDVSLWIWLVLSLLIINLALLKAYTYGYRKGGLMVLNEWKKYVEQTEEHNNE